MFESEPPPDDGTGTARFSPLDDALETAFSGGPRGASDAALETAPSVATSLLRFVRFVRFVTPLVLAAVVRTRGRGVVVGGSYEAPCSLNRTLTTSSADVGRGAPTCASDEVHLQLGAQGSDEVHLLAEASDQSSLRPRRTGT